MISAKIKEFLKESNAIENVYDKDSLKQAIYAWEYLEKENKLSPHNIKKTHKILMLHQPLMPNEKGYFRKQAVYIGGKEAVSYFKVPEQMKIWCDNVNFKPEFWKESHIAFEKIHPFVDGNGRVGRIFMNWQRVKKGMDILVIKEKEKQDYYKWFN